MKTPPILVLTIFSLCGEDIFLWLYVLIKYKCSSIGIENERLEGEVQVPSLSEVAGVREISVWHEPWCLPDPVTMWAPVPIALQASAFLPPGTSLVWLRPIVFSLP